MRLPKKLSLSLKTSEYDEPPQVTEDTEDEDDDQSDKGDDLLEISGYPM